MKKNTFILLLFLSLVFTGTAQEESLPDFKWGNGLYFNLNIGESIFFNNQEIKLLKIENQFNELKVGTDTVWLKVSKTTLPHSSQGVLVFVADNIKVKSLTDDPEIHGLLKKDALICLSEQNKKMLNPIKFVFPVSFNDGFLWSAGEDSHMFSYLGKDLGMENLYRSHAGIDIDLSDARGQEKHWIVALENSTVVWVKNKGIDKAGKEACVMLKSNSNPAIYYVYQHLYNKNLEVKKGQKLVRGELIGTVWGDENWGHLHLAVVKSDTVPAYQNRFNNLVNFFPQLYELYFNQSFSFGKSFSRGKICFGEHARANGNQKNVSSFEDYLGKGWWLGKWNKTNKVEWCSSDTEANARLKKVLFENTPAQSKNPQNWYRYEINVLNGVYRIRAKIGDCELPSWQKIEFENVVAATYSLGPGEQKWTTERVVKVNDRKLTIKIYIDESNQKVAGISEIVFQRAY